MCMSENMLEYSTGGTTCFVIPDGFRIVFLKSRCWKEVERNKKAGRIPVRTSVGPAKNLLKNDRETPSKT